MGTDHMSDRAKLAFRLAERRARQFGSAVIEPEHLLLGIISEEGGVGGVALRRLGATHDQFLSVLTPPEGPVTLPAGPLPWSSATEAAVARAEEEKVPLNRHFVCTEHLVLGLSYSGGGKVPEMLRVASITPERLRSQVIFLLQNS
jgi:ATP-dependent Clp protease ATP-binding subunit ClpC